MSGITEVTTEAFEKLNIKTITLKRKKNRFTNQIKQDTEEVNKF